MANSALQDIIALLGWPAAGNPAQYLFERAIAAAGLDCRFISVDVDPARLADALAGAAAMGFRGCLLAGPLRAAALSLVTEKSPAAAFAGAANLVDCRGGTLTAHMTDGRGLIEALRSHVDPANARALVVGAGGTGRAVALELALAGAASIVVYDREPDRAAALAEAVAALDRAASSRLDTGPAIAVPDDVEIVVVALPEASPDVAALTGLRPDLVVAETALAAQPSALAKLVAASAACLVDGLEVHAARTAIDFQSLTGATADTDQLREALDEFLA
jgi:shikimate dehydrogenase